MSGTIDHIQTEVDQQELVRQFLAQARQQWLEPLGPRMGC